MKKIIFWCLLLISTYGFGQTYPNFEPINNGLNEYEKLLYTGHTSWSVEKPTSITCDPTSFLPQNGYTYFEYQATTNSNFSFDLESKSGGFYFIVWKLNKSEESSHIIKSQTGIYTTIPYSRSINRGGQTFYKIGLNNTSSDNCEQYTTSGADGYLEDFNGSNQLKNDEKIIIGVYGPIDKSFSIDIHTIEQEDWVRDTECVGGSYSLVDVKNNIPLNPNETIKFFEEDESTEIDININPLIDEAKTVYAHILDNNNDIVKKYKIDFSFIPNHIYPFKTSFKDILKCTTSYTFNENEILTELLENGTDISKYNIVSINGNTSWQNQSIDISSGSAIIDVIIEYNGQCKLPSENKKITIKQGNPSISSPISDVTCDDNFTIIFDDIFNKIGFSSNNYDLIISLNGSNVTNNSTHSINIGTPLIFKIKIKDKVNGCESNEVDFTVNKTSPIDIKDASIDTCLNELTQEDIDDKIDLILNGTSATLTYWENGVEILENNLLNHIKTNLSGTITVIASLSNSCDTEKELTYNLSQSSLNISTINPLMSSCLEANETYTFTKNILENHIASQLGFAVSEFDFIDNDFKVNPNQTKSYRFKIKKSGETCWSDELTVDVKALNEPDFDLSSIPNQIADCDDNLIINNQWLIDEFGTDVLDYEIVINGQDYTNNQLISLDFSSTTTQNITIEIRNPNSASCSIDGSFIVEQKTQFTDDISTTQTWLNQEAQKIVFCEGDNPESQIQALMDYINANHSNLTFNKTVSEIAQEMTQTNGTVQLTISRVDECGEKFLTINYNKIDLPTLVLPTFDKICAGSLFVFDVSSFDPNFDYFITDSSGNTITPTANIFELVAGDYIMYATNSNGCRSVDYPFTITTFPDPIIKSVTIENGTLKIEAKNSSGGLLEYAITADGLIPNETDWQRKNEFTNIIQGINYTVWVRENGCGGISINNLYVLNLPNFISPNGDGINDVWRPIGTFNNDKTIRLQIFDRYGNTILSKEGVNDILLWDGKRNGYPVPTADYWYLVDYPQQNDNTTVINIKYSGNITVKNK